MFLPEEFASVMRHVVDLGAVVIGGCCGTTPAHIAEMVKQCKDIPVKPIEKKSYTVVSSYGQSVFLGTGSKIMASVLIQPERNALNRRLRNLILIIF